MTQLTALARAKAAETGRAQPIRTVRHVHLGTRPLVVIPLQLAGEACAPLAVMVGDDPDKPTLLTVYEPRDRAKRFDFTAALAEIILAHLDTYLPAAPAYLPAAPAYLPAAPDLDITPNTQPTINDRVNSSPAPVPAPAPAPAPASAASAPFAAPASAPASGAASSDPGTAAIINNSVNNSLVSAIGLGNTVTVNEIVNSSPASAISDTAGAADAAFDAATLANIDDIVNTSSATAVSPAHPEPCPDAPQLLVPNPRSAAFLGLLGRSIRFRRTDGEYAVRPAVPLLGRWLTHYAHRTEVPGSALLLPMTTVLAEHWATGQSAAEDGNLAALLGWIDPPPGLTGPEAARLAEDPVRCPPAGPVTDPTFDNEVLQGRMQAIRDATLTGDGPALARAQAAMDAALRDQLAPTWELMWRACALLARLPEASHADRRWKDDRRSFTDHVAWLRDGGAPQPRRDSAVAAARRLARLEREQQRLAVERAYDDPLVMAEYQLTGEAFAGTVIEADPARQDTSGKRAKLRPWITVRTADEVIVEPGTVLTSPDRPSQDAKVIAVTPASADASNADARAVGGNAHAHAHGNGSGGQARVGGDARAGGTLVILELSGGMGHAKIAPPGTVPAVGDEITYTTLRDEFQPPPKFPDRDETPWTHGGPPAEYVPTDEDAREDWS